MEMRARFVQPWKALIGISLMVVGMVRWVLASVGHETEDCPLVNAVVSRMTRSRARMVIDIWSADSDYVSDARPDERERELAASGREACKK